MKALIITCAAVAALALSTGSAQADGHGHGYGYGGYNYVAPSCHVQPHLVWHDTSHWDYIPPQIVNHGCHQHVIPGRWVFHQEGHYDVVH